MNYQNRSDIKVGKRVGVVLKQDQRSGNITEGVVKEIITSGSFHPLGIEVQLTSGQTGRVKIVK